jgi:hypothetical protein
VGVSQTHKVPRSIGCQRSTKCSPYKNIPPPVRFRALRRVIGFIETVGEFATSPTRDQPEACAESHEYPRHHIRIFLAFLSPCRQVASLNVTMTLHVYAHVLPDMQTEAAATLGGLLHGR